MFRGYNGIFFVFFVKMFSKVDVYKKKREYDMQNNNVKYYTKISVTEVFKIL